MWMFCRIIQFSLVQSFTVSADDQCYHRMRIMWNMVTASASVTRLQRRIMTENVTMMSQWSWDCWEGRVGRLTPLTHINPWAIFSYTPWSFWSPQVFWLARNTLGAPSWMVAGQTLRSVVFQTWWHITSHISIWVTLTVFLSWALHICIYLVSYFL